MSTEARTLLESFLESLFLCWFLLLAASSLSSTESQHGIFLMQTYYIYLPFFNKLVHINKCSLQKSIVISDKIIDAVEV